MLVGFLCFLCITSFMAFSWILALVVFMAGSSRGKKVKKGKKPILDKNKPILGRFTIGDFGDSEAEDSMDWDALSDSDDEAAVQGPPPVLGEIKEEERARISSPIIQYTRKKGNLAGGVRFNDTVISPIWGQKQSYRPEEKEAQPSTAQQGESSQPTSNVDSCQREHQQLMEEQTKLVQNLEEVRAELKNVKKKQSKLSKMLTNIYSLIGCSNSLDLDSD